MENLESHGILQISFSRPGKSWNLSVGHEKSWKMTKNDFLRTTKQEIPRRNDCFHIILKTTSPF